MVEIIQPDGCAEDVRMSPGLDLRSRPAVKTVSYLSCQTIRPASDTDYSMKNCLSSAGIPMRLIEHCHGQVDRVQHWLTFDRILLHILCELLLPSRCFLSLDDVLDQDRASSLDIRNLIWSEVVQVRKFYLRNDLQVMVGRTC